MTHRLLVSTLASASVLAGMVASPARAVDLPPPGASSCTGCHAPKRVADSVIPHIAGRTAADIVERMQNYRSGAWPSSVMGRIAKGFDDQQTAAIAAWFAAQPE
jgi:cytochrome c553